MHRIPGNISCDLGQIIYVLVNASSFKPLDVPFQNLQVHRSHDIEGAGQNLVLLLTEGQGQYCILLYMHLLIT